MNVRVSEFQLFQAVNLGSGETKELPPNFTAELEQRMGIGMIALKRGEHEPVFCIPLSNVAYFRLG
jgi:hypothetical protein